MTTPWMTSSDVLEQVKMRISLPISQETFTDSQILKLTNTVLFDSQVPSVLSYHEEFYVSQITHSLQSNQNRYQIPDRAIGMRLRDVWFKDNNGNLAKLTRINPDNQDIFQGNSNVNTIPYTFYIENNAVVLVALIPSSVTGSIVLTYFLRPNNLVENSRAFIVNNFSTGVRVDNSIIVAGDKLTISDNDNSGNTNSSLVFTAVASGAGALEFNIGSTSIETASNLAAAINNDGTYSATNQTPAVSTVVVSFNNRNTVLSTLQPTAFVISPNLILNSASTVPANITNSSYIDFLQTKPGHRIYSFDVLLGLNAVSGNSLVVNNSNVPSDFVVGDYVCSSYECIIPQLPPELHSLLVERTCERILQAQGDVELLGTIQSKIQDMEKNQGTLIDNRVDGSPQKVLNRSSLININKTRLNRYNF